jgi:dTDP-4-dehydrorhamnose reductase
MVGHELQRVSKLMVGGIDWRVGVFSHADLDVGDPGAIRSAFSLVSPAVVINCAAYTDVDGCESEQGRAFSLNGEVPGLLAQACRAAGVVLVHYSTEYVFDGASTRPYKEDDFVAPLSTYGRSKLTGEEAIRESGSAHLILRTQWLYGRYGRNFVDTILARAETGEEVRVVNDQRGAPTYARDLAVATLEALSLGLRGTYHAANAGHCTWYDAARTSVSLAGLDPSCVTATTTEEFARPAKRPAWGVLDTTKLAGAGVTLRAWEEALEEYVKCDRQVGGGKEEGPA